MESFSFVHATDVHVIDELSAQFVASAFQQINALQPAPDFVMFGGDYVENATVAEFEAFRQAFSTLTVKAHTLCGNHDLIDGQDPSRYVQSFGSPCYTFMQKGYLCIALDTTHRDYETYSWHGHVRPEVIAWLRGILANTSKNTPILLFTHHGLVGPTEDLSCDADNAEEVLTMFENHRLIAGFAGHAHRLRRHVWRGVPFFVNAAMSASRANPGGEPPGFFVVQVVGQAVSVAYHFAA